MARHVDGARIFLPPRLLVSPSVGSVCFRLRSVSLVGSMRQSVPMPRVSHYTYSPFWEYQKRSLRARLSVAIGGFDEDILERFYTLTPDQLAHLFNIYATEYGNGPAAYARKTYAHWKRGGVRPSFLTINRLLDSLPLVLNFDSKCELLRSSENGIGNRIIIHSESKPSIGRNTSHHS